MSRHALSRSLVRVLQAGVILAAAAVAVLQFAAIDARSHSTSDTLRPWLIQLGLIGLLAVAAMLVLGRLATRDAP